MHRSGTSCLAGSLQKSGVYFGNVSLKNKYNKKGNRENLEIMSLNEKILKHNNSTWSQPPNEVKWTKEHEQEGIKIVKQFNNECDSITWGFKDPRTLLTINFWEKILPQAIFIGSIRSPYNVALSLNLRDKESTIEEGLQLWLHYNQILLKLLNKNQFPLISFDLDHEQYQKKLITIKKLLSLPDTHQDQLFFDGRLRSHNSNNKYNYNDEINNCFKTLSTYLT